MIGKNTKEAKATRKLASIQQVKYVKPIEGADKIEVVGVLGWECVSKKGEFKEGDRCVYFEIDSLLPERPEFEFLRKSCWNETFSAFRLRTIKLRGQFSQGLALPVSLFPDLSDLDVGTDVTRKLKVKKYEPPIPASISGDVKKFTWPIRKTDEIRVQCEEEYGLISGLRGLPYYISVKLDGTSSTFLIDDDDEFHVCGRNYSYKYRDDHTFWQLAEKYNIEAGLRVLKEGGIDVAIQGEIVGPGIQKNPLGLVEPDLYVFNVVTMFSRKRLPLDLALHIVSRMGLKTVPILEVGKSFDYSREELLERAKGKYFEHFETANPDQEREGIVIRGYSCNLSMKAINNNFLL